MASCPCEMLHSLEDLHSLDTPRCAEHHRMTSSIFSIFFSAPPSPAAILERDICQDAFGFIQQPEEGEPSGTPSGKSGLPWKRKRQLAPDVFSNQDEVAGPRVTVAQQDNARYF